MAKSYREKRASYDKMQGVSYFEPDMNLLREKNPNHPLCKRKFLKPEKCQKEALWSLLDIISAEEIVKNRRAYFKKAEQKRIRDAIKECAKLMEQLALSNNLVGAKALCVAIKEKAVNLPEAVKAETVKIVDEVMADLSEKLDPAKIKAKKAEEAKATAITGLLKIDIDTAKQSVLGNYAKILGIKGENKKAATLRPLLKEYLKKAEEKKAEGRSEKAEEKKEQLPPADGTEKTGEGTGEEMKEVKGDLVEGEEKTEQEPAETEQKTEKVEQKPETRNPEPETTKKKVSSKKKTSSQK